jgi:4-amino-4-deoxy-L-arabinose transferase-like glycosyltransferase
VNRAGPAWRTYAGRLPLVAAFLVPAIVYVASASSEPASWDTAELQGVPYILGISHPTGFPFYVLIGYVWSHVVAIGSIALRMNAMSGVAMAVTCAAAYGVAMVFGASRAVALAATLWFALTENIWSHASRAEAQDVAVMCCALAIYAFLRWMREGGAWFAGAFALCGLGMAAHPNALWILPAFIVGAVIRRPRPPLRLVALSLGLMVAGLMLYAYLPLRSAYVVAHGLDPTATFPDAGGGIFWNYNDPRTLPGLIAELSGSESETPAYFLASLNPAHLAGALQAFVATLRAQFGTFATILMFVGLIVASRRDWRATLVLVIATTAALVFSVVYPNESDVDRYRLLVSWLAVPALGALTPRWRGPSSSALTGALVLLLAINAGVAFERGGLYFYHPAREGGRWVIDAVRPYVPPGSAIVTYWLDATSLAYGAYVDGSLPGRIVVSDNKFRLDLYRQWAAKRRVFVLVNPHDVQSVFEAHDYAKLDDYHELYEMQP